MLTEERKTYLYDCWNHESEDPESEEWREGLSGEEQALVAEWDARFAHGWKLALEKASAAAVQKVCAHCVNEEICFVSPTSCSKVRAEMGWLE